MQVERVENNLKKCREEKGVSQQDVADAVKVNRRSILRYEKGLGIPNLETALRLSRYYDKSVNDMFQLEEIDVVGDIKGIKKKQ